MSAAAWSVVLLAAFVAGPRSVDAQTRFAPAVEVTAGVGGSIGGTYYERVGPSAEVVLSGRPVANRSAFVSAVAVGVQAPLGFSDVCVLAPGGGCVPNFPSVYWAGALAGWETSAPRHASARLLLGPGYFWGEGGKAIALLSRIDLATPAIGPFALTGWARGTALPQLQGNPIALWAFGFGLRVR